MTADGFDIVRMRYCLKGDISTEKYCTMKMAREERYESFVCGSSLINLREHIMVCTIP